MALRGPEREYFCHADVDTTRAARSARMERLESFLRGIHERNVGNRKIELRGEPVIAVGFMPVFTVQQAVERKKMVNQFIAGVLIESEDYGKIPGVVEKKVLLKPGAEKLCSIFGMSVTYAEDKIIEDWTGAEHGGEPLFYYSYRAKLSRAAAASWARLSVRATRGSSKYRYRWVPEEVVKHRSGILIRSWSVVC